MRTWLTCGITSLTLLSYVLLILRTYFIILKYKLYRGRMRLQTLGDLIMAEECLRLAIASDNRHALAYNNLGVIEIRNGNVTAARTYFHAAANIASYVYEAHFNSAHLAYEVIVPDLFWCTPNYSITDLFDAHTGWRSADKLSRGTKVVERISWTLWQ